MESYTKIASDFGIIANYNTTVKTFSDGSKKLVFSSYDKLKGLEKAPKQVGTSSSDDLERYKYLNLQRTKQRIVDLAYENGCLSSWEFFVTLTFDDHFVEDSYSHDKVTYYLSKWLDSQKHLNPQMEYLLVAELHKSGRIHFHGLFKSVPNWKLVPAKNPHTGSNIFISGTQIFNLTNFKLGFTTVSQVKNQDAVSVYISKYITKDLLDIKNKKHYWRSKSLKLPSYEYFNTSLDEIKSYLNDKNVSYENIIEEDNFTTAYFSFK